jgi:cytochrome c-type biogenesis protein
MSGPELLNAILLPIGLGLFGFIEPCSIGSTLVFLKVMEGHPDATKVRQVAVFTVTRAVFIGLLGVLAVVVGSAFLTFQKAAWLVLGGLYAAIGLFYVSGRAGLLMTTLGPSLSRLSGVRGSAALGVLFGLNIPACAAPLLFALLGTAAAGGGAGAGPGQGFLSLGLFGFALSLPLAMAVLFPWARGLLDRFAGLSRRLPVWTGLLMIALGGWSVWFGLFVTVAPTA